MRLRKDIAYNNQSKTIYLKHPKLKELKNYLT